MIHERAIRVLLLCICIYSLLVMEMYVIYTKNILLTVIIILMVCAIHHHYNAMIKCYLTLSTATIFKSLTSNKK